MRTPAAWLVLVACGCNDAITLQITSDRPIPAALDAICVGVADQSLRGGQFGQMYRLQGELDSLPQTLRVEPGGADHAWAWVRGDHGGVPVARAAGAIDFGHDLRLALDKCVSGHDGSAGLRGAAVEPADARLVASQGQGGTVVVAVAPGVAKIIDAGGDGLTSSDAPVPPAGTPVDVIAADLDGDCDDDIVIATTGAPPEIWRRDGATFVDVAHLGSTPAAAIAAADVDQDGDIDLVVGSGGTLTLYTNDGAGNFTATAIESPPQLTAVSAIAIADFTGDGNPDLVVGQAGGVVLGWLGEAGGSFQANAGLAPPVSIAVHRVIVGDVDGDLDPDLIVTVIGQPIRLWVARDGRLEDQSFALLPKPIATANAVGIGGWDGNCEPDLVLAADAGAQTLSGTSDGTFVGDAQAPAGSDVVMADIDDDGAVDAVIATHDGVVWLAR